MKIISWRKGKIKQTLALDLPFEKVWVFSESYPSTSLRDSPGRIRSIISTKRKLRIAVRPHLHSARKRPLKRKRSTKKVQERNKTSFVKTEKALHKTRIALVETVTRGGMQVTSAVLGLGPGLA